MAICKAIEPFSYVREDGVLDVVNTERLFDSEDPVVRKRPSLFEAVETVVARTSHSETASAAPGEVRTTSRRGRRPVEGDV
ncbi:Uncharacterised protein [Mycobacteroides abscessus subsp. massiliense]|nr:Uncharacterised protein [Mycobacteroides abscessus subsp. massiliense]SKR74190.1 Uncharacterised protein [Mycobacteroides abscessus subsp. massiliense]SKS39007.1 Uncharacterised protein [Mycobacteroides abscessus subsp. massiliense]SKS90815.1 Uncharacterised protein [Mycobacteroides abscessus subsp. massiliense]SKT24807.1 Uncharacterised protein [Mycobacteroides abscessus subsp. massiliense]